MTEQPINYDDLLRAIEAMTPGEFDCDQFLDYVAAYLDHGGSTDKLPPELARVEQHLATCPECLEEYQALVRGAQDAGS